MQEKFSPRENKENEEDRKSNVLNRISKKYEDKVDRSYLDDKMWGMGASYRALGIDGLKSTLQSYKEKGLFFKKYSEVFNLIKEKGENFTHYNDVSDEEIDTSRDIDFLAECMNEIINNPENIDEQVFLKIYNALIKIFRIDGLLLTPDLGEETKLESNALATLNRLITAIMNGDVNTIGQIYNEALVSLKFSDKKTARLNNIENIIEILKNAKSEWPIDEATKAIDVIETIISELKNN